MSETTSRKPFGDVHENPSASADAELPVVSTKKQKTAPQQPINVMTFQLSHSPVQVQILSNMTLYALVDIICRETTVGMEESVDDHMWDVVVPTKEGVFNSSDDYVDGDVNDWADEPYYKASQTKLCDLELPLNSTMTLKYDYGSTSCYNITLVEETPCEDYDQAKTIFPRPKPAQALPQVEFTTDHVDLNTSFPTLNKWLLEAQQLNLNLFQPGRKHNYGLLERGNAGVRHMIYLPVKPGNDLADYLHCLDYASQFEYSKSKEYGYPNNNWYSMVILPRDVTTQTYQKYGSNPEPGFCEAKIAPHYKDLVKLNTVFPKLAALAGCSSSSSTNKTTVKGWITYKDHMLRVCAGACAATPKCNYQWMD